MIMLRLPRDRDIVSVDLLDGWMVGCLDGWMAGPARDVHQSQIKKDHSAVGRSL